MRNRIGSEKHEKNISEKVEDITILSTLPQDPAISISQDAKGSIYIGQVENSHRHGQGSVFYANGEFLSGTFHYDTFVEGIQFHNGRCVWYGNGNVLGETTMLRIEDQVVVYPVFLAAQRLTRVLSERQALAPSQRSRNRRVLANSSEQHCHEPFHDSLAGVPNDVGPYSRATNKTQRFLSYHGNTDEESNTNLREEVAHTASLEAFFACSSPMCTETLSTRRFFQRLFVFLFPYFALPGFLCAPCAIDSNDIEREFIVSGASLQRSFDSPSTSMYVVALALAFAVAGVALFFLEGKKFGKFCTGSMAADELFSPINFWILFGIMCATYFGFRRIPHGLEHMNRELTAELTALAANVIDSKSKVCIYTWDETGRDKEKNKWFRLKWMIISFFSAIFLGLDGVLFRLLLHFNQIGFSLGTDFYSILLMASSCLLSFLVTYYALKNLDLQREVLSKLRVLTRTAYLQGKCVVEPCTSTGTYFSCDLPLDITNLKDGFSGWFTTRSLVLCASPVANHHSRAGVMSIVILYVCLYSAICVIRALISGALITRCQYPFVLAHGMIIIIILGTISIGYIGVCASIRTEQKRHLYIMDVVCLYHQFSRKDIAASNIIEACREMVDIHDIKPTFFKITFDPFLSSLLIFWILVGMCVSVVLFAAAVAAKL